MANIYIREPQYVVALEREEGWYNVAVKEAGLELIYIDKKFYQVDVDVEKRKKFFKKNWHLRQEGEEGNKKYQELLKELYDTDGEQIEQKVITKDWDLSELIERIIS